MGLGYVFTKIEFFFSLCSVEIENRGKHWMIRIVCLQYPDTLKPCPTILLPSFCLPKPDCWHRKKLAEVWRLVASR